MKDTNRLRSLLPVLVAMVLFAVLGGYYFFPQFQGETLPMHDVLQYKGMSQDIRTQQAATGEDPQWTGGAFSGMPAYLINIQYPSLILRNGAYGLMDALGAPLSMLFLAMLGFWLMLRMMKVDPWIALAPAVAYGFSTYSILIIGAGHISKMWALAYAPLMIGAIVYTLRGRNVWLGLFLTALFTALEISTSHPQITYYFGLVAAAVWINELVQAIRAGQLRQLGVRTAALLGAALLAVGANFAPLYYTASHTKDTTRGGTELRQQGDKPREGLDLEYATAWSYGPAESFNLYIPGLYGGASDGGFASDGEVARTLARYNARGLAQQLPPYWGEQPATAGPTYLGAVMVFLCVLALFTLHGRNKWYLVAVSVFGLLLAWGSHAMWFTELMFRILPGYDKFRAVSTALVILQWSVPFLAALALCKLWGGRYDRRRMMRGLRWALGITGGIALIFLLMGGVLFDFVSPIDGRLQLPEDITAAMRSERAAMLRADSFRSLVFVLLTAGLAGLFLHGKIKKGLFAAGLVVLVCIDMIPVDMRFLPHSKFTVQQVNDNPVPTAADRLILADTTAGFRVADFTASTFSDARASFFHRSVGGYHGAKLQRYQEVIERYLSQMNQHVYDMLDTRYFIIPDPQTGEPLAQLNPGAYGPAWFVDDIVWAADADSELDLLGKVDLRHNAIVDERFQSLVGTPAAADSTAAIRLTAYRPNYLRYEYDAPQPGVAVFSEIYYDKGWTARIDGKPAPHFRANYILRSMTLPAGKHTVEFSFRAPHFAAVSGVTLASSLVILFGLLVATLYPALRKKRYGHEPSEE